MMEHPKISIIVPFWNTERFLAEAIDSVLQQSYDGWELLLINDGSQDGSSKIALDYAHKYPRRIRYLDHPDLKNHGISGSRNLGIEHATGLYTGFLDADDVWLPQKLEEQIEVMAQEPAISMVYGPANNWFSWSGKPDDSTKDDVYVPPLAPNRVYQPPELLLEFLQGRIPVPASSNPLYKTEMLKRIHGFEESFPMIVEMEALILKIYLQESVFFANKCWSKYRIREDSIHVTVPQLIHGVNAQYAVLKWFETYLDEKGESDPQVKAALKARLKSFHKPGPFRKVARKLKFWFRKI